MVPSVKNFGKATGQILLEKGVINQEHVRLVLEHQKRTGELFLEILHQQGLVSEEVIACTLAEQSNFPVSSLKSLVCSQELQELVPKPFAHRHKLIPVSRTETTLTIAIANPFDVPAIDQLQMQTNLQIWVTVATEREIVEAINRNYGKPEVVVGGLSSPMSASLGHAGGPAPVAERAAPSRLLGPNELRGEGGAQTSTPEGTVPVEMAESGTDSPIIKLVDRILERAVGSGATDIHIEPEEKVVTVRYRIDGVLHQEMTLAKVLQSALTTRIKIMCRINITENRLPQDGRALWNFGNKKIDLRASTFPTVWGETIALRILDRESLILGLDRLGLSPESLTMLRGVIAKPHGLILVTGPTGSGKTTTLYSVLSQLDVSHKNILTLEDPVEYELSGIRQSQINLRAGLTFASGLRAILRQDPDIIFIGEIRDAETAEMAIRAALTGHLVFSTLHTNNAAGAVPRLIDMGIQPYLVASSLVAVIAQRLVRVICPLCKVPAPIDPVAETLLRSRREEGGKTSVELTVYKGAGCTRCLGTGFRGRIAIFEMLRLTEELRRLITDGAETRAALERACKGKMKLMLEDGIDKVLQGLTTIEEVVQATQMEGTDA